MRRVVRWAVVVVLILHGLPHLFGAIKGFGWANVSVLKGPIGPTLGAAWLAAGTLVVIAAVLLAARIRWWWVVGAVAVLASQSVILTSWNDAKVGSVANIILLAAVVYGYAAQGPTSYRAEYRHRADVAFSAPLPNGIVTEADLAALPQIVATYVRRSGAVGVFKRESLAHSRPRARRH